MSTLSDRYTAACSKYEQYDKDYDIVLDYLRNPREPITTEQSEKLKEEAENIMPVASDCDKRATTLNSSDFEVQRDTSAEEYDKLEKVVEEYEGYVEKLQDYANTCKDILGIS